MGQQVQKGPASAVSDGGLAKQAEAGGSGTWVLQNMSPWHDAFSNRRHG